MRINRTAVMILTSLLLSMPGYAEKYRAGNPDTGSFPDSLFGYRAQPVGLSIIVFVVYWLVIIVLFCRRGKNHED